MDVFASTLNIKYANPTCNITGSALIENGVKMGTDCFVGHAAQIRPGTVMGNNSEIRAFCFVAKNVTIGNNVKIMQYGNIGEGAVIEDDVFISARVLLLNTKKIKHCRDFPLVLTPVTIKRGARIGGGAMIAPGVTIGENPQVGIGSVVTKDVPDGECWVGNPAKFLRMVPEDELI